MKKISRIAIILYVLSLFFIFDAGLLFVACSNGESSNSSKVTVINERDQEVAVWHKNFESVTIPAKSTVYLEPPVYCGLDKYESGTIRFEANGLIDIEP